MREAAVAVILCLLVVQSAMTSDTLLADQTNPRLKAAIVSADSSSGPCSFVNEAPTPTLLFHFECKLGVEVSTSDDSHPEVAYLWTDHGLGGSFNSTTSQWIEYRSPQGMECLRLTVTVSASGYESASDGLKLINMTIPHPSGDYVHNCPLSILESTSTTTTARIESLCTVVGMGSLHVHVADESGVPIQNAIIMINGTFTCFVDGTARSGIADRWGTTDSDGYVLFGVYPTKYDVSVILPGSLETILVTQITAPVGTYRTTLDIVCTPSADQCRVAVPGSETPTTSIMGGLLAVPFLDFPAAIIAIILGFFIVAKLRRTRD